MRSHANRTDHYDVVVVGAGIIGLATAWSLARSNRHPHVLVVDKEDRIAAHQTGRNSGVVHSGLYYAPGSRKARFAVSGANAIVNFARERGIAYERCGKVVVACEAAEIPRLANLHRRGLANGVASEWLSTDQIREFEPHVRGVAGLHVPSTGIIDFVGVCAALHDEAVAADTEVALSSPVVGIVDDRRCLRIRLDGSGSREVTTSVLVNCAGLQSDRLSTLAGIDPAVRIIPFRGEYFELAAQRRDLVNNLIYPVPNPAFPFLGVHFTRMTTGAVECGPNAVLALAREGYARTDIDLKDLRDSLAWPGLQALARKHWRVGAVEATRSVSKRAFARALARLVPEVEAADLVKASAGVRAQAVRLDGRLVDDFEIAANDRVISVLNAPSPAATASLPIGAHIAKLVLDRVDAVSW